MGVSDILLKTVSFGLLLLLTNCTKNEVKSTSTVKNIDVNVDYSEDLYMSDYFSDIEYVRLNTPDDRPIGNIFKIISKKSHLFLFDRTRKSVWIFDSVGNYINEIKITEGRGPAELENLIDIYISNDLKLHAVGQFKNIAFNMNGEIEEAVNTDFNASSIFYDEKNKIYVGYVATMMNTRVDEIYKNKHLLLFDKKGQIIGSNLTIRKGSEGIRYNIPKYFSEFKEDVFFSPHLQDTIYKYNDGKFEPYYYLNFYDRQVSNAVLEKRYDYNTVIWDWREFWDKEIIDKGLISNITFYEIVENYIFFRVGNKNTQHIVVYNKIDNSIRVGGKKLINDIDLAYSPYIYSSSDNELISIIEVNDFIDIVHEVKISNKVAMENEKFNQLMKFSNSLELDGNPIIVKYILKE